MGCGHPENPGEIFANVFSMRNFITSITVSQKVHILIDFVSTFEMSEGHIIILFAAFGPFLIWPLARYQPLEWGT